MLTWNSVSAAAPFTTYTSWANTFGPLAWMFSTNPERSEASPSGARGMCWEWYTASAPAEVGRARTAIVKAPAASAIGRTTSSSGPQPSKLLLTGLSDPAAGSTAGRSDRCGDGATQVRPLAGAELIGHNFSNRATGSARQTELHQTQGGSLRITANEFDEARRRLRSEEHTSELQ